MAHCLRGMDDDRSDRQGGKNNRDALGRTDLTPQKTTRPRLDDDDSEGASTAMEPEVDSNAAGMGASADGETGDAAAVERGSGEAAAVGESSRGLERRDPPAQNTAQDGTSRVSVSVARGWARRL